MSYYDPKDDFGKWSFYIGGGLVVTAWVTGEWLLLGALFITWFVFMGAFVDELGK